MGEEYERFEITDYDLDNEFNPNRARRRTTKHQQTYGIWADDSEDEDVAPEMQGSRGGRADRRHNKDFSKGVNFVSGGVQGGIKKNKDKTERTDNDSDDVADDDPKRGFGFSREKYSSESDEDIKPVKQKKNFQPTQNLRANTSHSFAGMRKFDNSNPSLLNKGVGDWEQHTKGIGAKLLLQMGYKPGKGLGKTLQGIHIPVESHVRKGRGAIGAYGPERKTSVADLKSTTNKKVKDEKNEHEEEGKKQWSKKGHQKRYFFKSVEDVIEKGKKPDYIFYDSNKKASQVKVIDMTGPEKRILSSYHALSQAKIDEDELFPEKLGKSGQNFQLPELMHNLSLIVDLCEQDIIGIDKKQRLADDRQNSLNQEREHLEKIVELEKEYIHTLDGAVDLIQKLVDTEGDLSLEEAERIFVQVKLDFPNEYKEFNLGDLAPGIIAPLITIKLTDWNPLTEPGKHVSLIKKWGDILDYYKSQSTSVFEPYPALVWSSITPCFRRAAATWNPRVHQQMAALLDFWAPLLPEWMLDNVLEQLVLQKITQAVNDWDPLTDTVPIHTWILPWTGLLGPKMETNVYKIIRDKLSNALKAWHPADRSARAMLTPWKNVFPEEDLQMFFRRNIVPKLEMRMSEVVLHPLHQDLETFHQVWEWHELISPLVMAQILDKYFFPKWMQTLVLWLNQAPNFDEVSRWYSGWKSLLSENVLKQTNIKEHFRKALELMQRSTGVTITDVPVTNTIKPPSLLEMNIVPPPSLEFKEMVSIKCAERGIIFAPMPGKRESGKQVYRVGKLFCYIDRTVCIISPDGGVSWNPISLNALLEKALSG